MIIYHVYRYYPGYSDRYPDEEIGYYSSKPHAEGVQRNATANRTARGKVGLDEIEVDETP